MAQRHNIKSVVSDGAEIFSLSESDRAVAEIVPAWGNNCFSYIINDNPVLERVAFDEFQRRPTSFGIPILFPFPNRIRDGEFRFRGRRFRVDPNRHGFVRDKAWTVIDSGATDTEGAWVKSEIEAAQFADRILSQFPFPFRIEVTWRLRGGRLAMETVIHNTGEEDMPCGFGIHPYFQCPEKGLIKAPARKLWELDDYLPTGNLLEAEGKFDLRIPGEIDGLDPDDIYTDLIPDSDGLVRCSIADQIRGTETMIEFEARQFPHLVVYKTPAPRRAICVEPYTCPTDGFNLQDGGIDCNVIVLRPGESIELVISIYSRSLARV